MTADTMTQHGTVPPRTGAIGARPFGLLRHSLALARRSLVKTKRTPEQFFDVVFQPIIFIVMFVYLLGGAISGSTSEYLTFLMPALLVMNTIFAAPATGVNLNTDIAKGVFDRFRSLPISRAAPLIGSVLGDVMRFVVAIVVQLGFAYALGFRIETNPVKLLAACLLVIGFSFCVSWAFVFLGMVVRTPGSAYMMSFMLLFPLTFGSNVLAPTDTMPGWLQAWVKVNPVVDLMEACRGLMIGGPVARPVTLSVLWGLGILAVFAPLAVRAYRRRA